MYGDRAEAQINSRLETPQLLGIIKYEVWKRGLFIYIQTAMQVKTRWSDEILQHKGYIRKNKNKYMIGDTVLSTHIKDSIRHAVHYATYNSKYKEVNNGKGYNRNKNS